MNAGPTAAPPTWMHRATATRPAFFLLIILAGAPMLRSQTTPPPAPVESAGRLAPWLDLQTGTVGARFKNAQVTGQPWEHESQYQYVARGRFKFDRKGTYYTGFRLSTGDYFSYSWNDLGIGPGGFESRPYLRELFFSASPGRLFELQVGGIGFNRGESSEVTSYSNNGYLMGERLAVRRPDRLYFDEISATGGFIGDLYEPGVFGRFHRLSQMNYHQFLVLKRIRRQLSLSADYSSHDGVQTLRQAVRLQAPANPFVDSVLFENYQRLDFHPDWGCAISFQRNATRRLTLVGGFTDIDEYYVPLNSDKLGRGKRFYIIATYNFWGDFSAVLSAGRAFATDYPVKNAGRFDFAISYDFLKMLKRAEIL